MIYTKLTNKALRLAFNKHKEQVDQSGLPYVFHPYEVASSMNDEFGVCVALLHDILEDTDTSVEDLIKEGFPVEVIDAVKLMTHREDEDYFDYIRRIKTNKLATKVKLSDLRHNSNLTRLENITEWDLKRNEKYAMAMKLLEEI